MGVGVAQARGVALAAPQTPPSSVRTPRSFSNDSVNASPKIVGRSSGTSGDRRPLPGQGCSEPAQVTHDYEIPPKKKRRICSDQPYTDTQESQLTEKARVGGLHMSSFAVLTILKPQVSSTGGTPNRVPKNSLASSTEVEYPPATSRETGTSSSTLDPVAGSSRSGIISISDELRSCMERLAEVEQITERKLKAMATQSEELRARNRDLVAENTLLSNSVEDLSSEIKKLEDKLGRFTRRG